LTECVDADGRLLSHAQVIRGVIAEAELANSLGVDFLGVGKHHRADFAISAPEVVLAAFASRGALVMCGSIRPLFSPRGVRPRDHINA
jgi:alkanesulfonate monooxygenase SsuD/methylene tetrahydromethanopterin reductase-like flavin-dependent oxidoreductase (luciferase family)